MTLLREVTRAELVARRRDVLDQLGMSWEELEHKAADRSLVGDEWSAREEIREIDFLLGDDDRAR